MKKNLFNVLILLALVMILTACEETRYVHVGPNWAAINDLKPSTDAFKVSVSGGDSFKVGESMAYTVTSEKSGRLWVVQVDPEDRLTVLFPNDYSPDNQIKANEKTGVPPSGAGWEIAAEKPLGQSVLAFVVTQGDTDLSQVLARKEGMTKAVVLITKSPSWGLEKKVVDVKE